MRKGDPARWVTFLAEPTFFFSCKQFATCCKETYKTFGRLWSLGYAGDPYAWDNLFSIYINRALPVILLQIAMLSPGTHLVKNHESLSITNESQLKKKTTKKQEVRN